MNTDDYREGWRAAIEAAVHAANMLPQGYPPFGVASRIHALQPPEAPVREGRSVSRASFDAMQDLKREAEVKSEERAAWWLRRYSELDAELQRLREQHTEAMRLLGWAIAVHRGKGFVASERDKWLTDYDALLQREPNAR